MASWTKIRFIETGVKNECSICGLGPEWNGRPLVLELDHIDGNNRNDLHDNLRLLCPNCHSQQPTTNRRKSIRASSTKRIRAEVVIEMAKAGKNPRQILLSLGCSDTGANYAEVRRIFDSYNFRYDTKLKLGSLDGRKGPRPSIRKVKWPTKDELEALIELKSVVQIAKQFGVTGNAVVKWLAVFGLKSKPRGFWAKVYSNSPR